MNSRETDDVLVEPWLFSFDYKRTTGPVIGRFYGGLLQRRVLGMRRGDGSVMVPPTGYDPATGAALDEWVEVGTAGRLESWSWVSEPLDSHPFDEPFGWALVRLDGADTNVLHALRTSRPEALRRGTRVVIEWAEETSGSIRDIVCFVPEDEL